MTLQMQLYHKQSWILYICLIYVLLDLFTFVSHCQNWCAVSWWKVGHAGAIRIEFVCHNDTKTTLSLSILTHQVHHFVKMIKRKCSPEYYVLIIYTCKSNEKFQQLIFIKK